MNKRQFIVIFLVLLSLGFLLSMSIGPINVSIKDIYNSIFNFTGTKAENAIITVRLPRFLLSIVVGVSLAVAGSIMQGLTNNPLASPQLIGANSGAALSVVLSMYLFGGKGSLSLTLMGFLGALLGGVIVYALCGRDFSPIRLSLAGFSVHLLLSSITQGIIIINSRVKDNIIFWLVGSLDKAKLEGMIYNYLFLFIVIIICIVGGKKLDTLSLGDEVALSLGENTKFLKIVYMLMALLLTGFSVSLAGPVAFVGLVVPNMVKRLLGDKMKDVIIYSALGGGLLLIYSDIASRLVSYPFEMPVGITTALLGAPYFLWLVKRRDRSEG